MKYALALLQIGELFEGHLNWRGFAQLFLLIAMGLIAVGFTFFVGYKAFRSKRK